MQKTSHQGQENGRLRIVGVFFIAIGVIFSLRLFYLQIVKGAEYRREADQIQTQSLEIEPKRGLIYAWNGEQKVPLVLNERRWLVFADSVYVDDVDEFIRTIAPLGVNVTPDQAARLREGSRYVILAKDLSDDQKETVVSASIPGLYFQESSKRAYTEGSLAAQILGFVNADGIGQYGVEERYTDALTGTPGQLKAITDSRGVPLAFEESNIAIEPENGQDITLTIDVGVQKIIERALQNGVQSTSSLGGSVIVLDADTGAVEGIANYPTFNPSEFSAVDDIRDYTNRAISEAIEPGSVTKVLVAATALDSGAVSLDHTYFDPARVVLDGAEVKNAIDYAPQERRLEDILTYSLNTGTIHLLKLMGGGEVNERARTTLHDYYVNSFGLGQRTGIDLNNEAAGRIYGPNEGFGLNIRYGNMTFGQGMSVTPLQIASAYASIINGGKQITPYVIDSIGETKNYPAIKQTQVLKQTTIDSTRELMRRMALANYPDVQIAGYEISGKTGTAQIPDGEGGYIKGRFTATFAGYIKSPNKSLVIFVRLDQPQVQYASLQGSAPIWKEIVKDLVSTGKVN